MASNNYKNPTSGPPVTNRPAPAAAPENGAARPRGNTPRAASAAASPPAAAPTARGRSAAAKPASVRPPRPPRPPGAGFSLGQALALLKDRRFHLLVGFSLLLGSLYLTIAFTSFLFSGRADQSVVAALGTVPVKEAGQESGNLLGLLGAWMAEKLIYRGFGLSAYALIPIVFFLGYKIVFRRAKGSVSYVLALGLFTMLWTSILLGYIVVQMAQPGTDPAEAHRLDWLSGSGGYELASWLQSLIGWGTVLLLAFGLIMFVVFFFNITSLDLGLGSRDDDEEEADTEAAEAPVAAAPAPAIRPATARPAPTPQPSAEEEEFDSEPEYEPAPAPRPSPLKAPVLSTSFEIAEPAATASETEVEPAPWLPAAGAALPLWN